MEKHSLHSPQTQLPKNLLLPGNRYVVQFGDTLSGISHRFLGESRAWREVAKVNGLTRPDVLLVGQVLKIPLQDGPAHQGRTPPPAPPFHIVVEGETVGTHPPPAGSSGPPVKAAPEPDHGLKHERPASRVLARGTMFVVIEVLPEVGAKNVIRKVAVIPKDFSLHPGNPAKEFSLAEHAMAEAGKDLSPFISLSNKPTGAASMNIASADGGALLIDLDKVRAAGGKVFTVEEVWSICGDTPRPIRQLISASRN